MSTEAQIEAFSFTGRFNTLLEQCLLDGNSDNHHIISIDAPLSEFDLCGNLKENGQRSFWREIDWGLKRFMANDIKLKPRATTANANANYIQPKKFIKSIVQVHHNHCNEPRKLPMPLPLKRRRCSRSWSRSSSKNHHTHNRDHHRSTTPSSCRRRHHHQDKRDAHDEHHKTHHYR